MNTIVSLQKRIFTALLVTFGLSVLAFIPVAYGAPADPCSKPDELTTKQQTKCGVDKIGGGTDENKGDQVTTVIKNVIGILSFLVGLIAVLMIVIAGFRFVTSNGDAGTVSSAKNTIIYAVIGIIITIMAYAIVNFIIDNLS